jgi:hypothetical protein
LRKKLKKKITEVKRDNGWNRERDVKERYENFIQVIKEKLGETTPKRKTENHFGNGGQGNITNKEKQPECVWWNRECDKIIRLRKAKLLKLYK